MARNYRRYECTVECDKDRFYTLREKFQSRLGDRLLKNFVRVVEKCPRFRRLTRKSK